MFIVLFLSGTIFSKAQDYSYKPEYSTVLDSTFGKVLLHQCSRATPKSVKKNWNPTKDDIEKLEKNFKKVLELRATVCCIIGLPVPSLDGYAFQYLGVTINKRKYIYINAFANGSEEPNKSFKNWEFEPVVVCDGGEHYWGVLFDLEKLEFSQLSFNGIV